MLHHEICETPIVPVFLRLASPSQYNFCNLHGNHRSRDFITSTNFKMAFSPRSNTAFGLPPRKESPLELAFDLNSFVRQAPHDERDKPLNTAQQRLWLDITHLDTTQLEQIDDDYNSNKWKNFKFVRPKHSADRERGRKSLQSPAGMIADIYPLSVPKPSRIGDHTYQKFLQEVKLPPTIQKVVGWQKQGKQELQSRTLKAQSECRAPPLDWEGNIIPPAKYKRYPRMETFLSDEFVPFYSSYSTPFPRKIHSIRSSSLYSPSRQGIPWHYGLRVKRPHFE